MTSQKNTSVDRFTAKDNALMTNSILQMMTVVFVSAYMMFSTQDDHVWMFSALAFCSSFLVIQLSEGSYETDYENYGIYSGVSGMYDNLAMASCFSLLAAIIIYFRNTWIIHPLRMYTAWATIFLIISYLFVFAIRRK